MTSLSASQKAALIGYQSQATAALRGQGASEVSASTASRTSITTASAGRAKKARKKIGRTHLKH